MAVRVVCRQDRANSRSGDTGETARSRPLRMIAPMFLSPLHTRVRLMSFRKASPKVQTAVLALLLAWACSPESTPIATDPLAPPGQTVSNFGASQRNAARDAVFAG